MENISKTKHNGGRPRQNEIMEQFLLLSDNGTLAKQSKRNLNNELYVTHAMAVLYDLPNQQEFTYLMEVSKDKFYKKTILQHLGRIGNRYSDGDEIIPKLAKIICDEKYNTSKAIDFIHRYRIQSGDKLNKDKIIGTLKKIKTVIRNSGLDGWGVNLLMTELEDIKIKDLIE